MCVCVCVVCAGDGDGEPRRRRRRRARRLRLEGEERGTEAHCTGRCGDGDAGRCGDGDGPATRTARRGRARRGVDRDGATTAVTARDGAAAMKQREVGGN